MVGPTIRILSAALLAGLLATPVAAETVGKVVAVRGQVTAQAPGEEPRTLACDDPIQAGDRLVSAEGAKLGVMSNGVYSGINEKSTLRVGTNEGAPDLDLERGHLRVVEAAGSRSGRIVTPGLVAANAASDTEALVFPEKLGVVSMLCPREGELAAATPGGDTPGINTPAGQCAVRKPKEPLFTAAASHDLLPMIDDACGAIPVAGTVMPRFNPADVALGPVDAGPNVGPPIAVALDPQGIRNGCDAGCSPSGRSLSVGPGVRPSPFPNRGPP